MFALLVVVPFLSRAPAKIADFVLIKEYLKIVLDKN